jgi:hypothetical protein
MYPRFCRTPNSPVDYHAVPTVICLSPTTQQPDWQSVTYWALPSLVHSAATRFNQTLMQHLAKPTRLALSCTLAWPGALLHLPVGSYPTLSPLTKQDLHPVGGTALCCGCSQAPVTRRLPPLTVSWGNLSADKPKFAADESREVPLPKAHRIRSVWQRQLHLLRNVLESSLLYFALYENRSLLSPVEFSKTTVFITTAV